jgi:hypothetical protein
MRSISHDVIGAQNISPPPPHHTRAPRVPPYTCAFLFSESCCLLRRLLPYCGRLPLRRPEGLGGCAMGRAPRTGALGGCGWRAARCAPFAVGSAALDLYPVGAARVPLWA